MFLSQARSRFYQFLREAYLRLAAKNRNHGRYSKSRFYLDALEPRLALTATVAATYRALPMEYNGTFSGTATAPGYFDSHSGNAKVSGNLVFSSSTVAVGTLAGSGTGSGHDNFGNYGFMYGGQTKVTMNNGAMTMAEVAGSTNYQYTSGGMSGTGGGFLGQVAALGYFNPSTFAASVSWNGIVQGATVKGSSSGTVTDKAATNTDIVASAKATTTAVELTATVTGKFMRTTSMGTATATANAYWSTTADMSGVLSTINLGSAINIFWNSNTVKMTNDAIGPAPAAAKFLVFKVDSTNKIAEANEVNNIASIAVTSIPARVLYFDVFVTPSVTPASCAAGQEVTLKAVVAPVVPGTGTPTGTVTFRDGTTVLQTVTLVNGTAVLKTRTLTIGTHSLTASYNGSTTFEARTSAVVTATIVANHAPVLNTAKSPTLNAIPRNAAAPVGAVGTLVSSLVDFATPVGQRDNVTDSDPAALLGVAVTKVDTTNGTWFYSTNNGATWAALGASTTLAKLLAADASTRIYFRPNAGFVGTIAAAITFRAWDFTAGINGGTLNVSTFTTASAFSKYGDTASIVVT
jgi:hypothetical protein